MLQESCSRKAFLSSILEPGPFVVLVNAKHFFLSSTSLLESPMRTGCLQSMRIIVKMK